ncbi:unnamed protein product [Bursaphelenchus xylophilus]|uniref:(pine wood nematode) hypothetical protein n=1 Tax=Bursaphelenchus xylophilus TaxID=6326 RepID=A0A1I7RTM8_BURXY|nr:unnamed protein product [Bursaphelenchus xylophilus]CAG9122299.1 unnamed protein product [Bursaphelenchus xylophilus]
MPEQWRLEHICRRYRPRLKATSSVYDRPPARTLGFPMEENLITTKLLRRLPLEILCCIADRLPVFEQITAYHYLGNNFAVKNKRLEEMWRLNRDVQSRSLGIEGLYSLLANSGDAAAFAPHPPETINTFLYETLHATMAMRSVVRLFFTFHYADFDEEIICASHSSYISWGAITVRAQFVNNDKAWIGCTPCTVVMEYETRDIGRWLGAFYEKESNKLYYVTHDEDLTPKQRRVRFSYVIPGTEEPTFLFTAPIPCNPVKPVRLSVQGDHLFFFTPDNYFWHFMGYYNLQTGKYHSKTVGNRGFDVIQHRDQVLCCFSDSIELNSCRFKVLRHVDTNPDKRASTYFERSQKLNDHTCVYVEDNKLKAS